MRYRDRTMTMPDVLKDPATEPEAAALRSALRRVRDILGSDWVDCGEARSQISEVVKEALDRPTTNGDVIDTLVRENGDLRSQVSRLEDRNRDLRQQKVAESERLKQEIDQLKEQIRA